MSKDVRQLVGGNVKRLRETTPPSRAELKARERVRGHPRVRRHRQAPFLSQAELAARLGVDRAHVSSLEQGKRNITIVSLWHIAEALDVQIGAFFEELPRT